MIDLNVPYENQRNNYRDPDGSCGVACPYMLLLWNKISVPGQYKQGCDNLDAYFSARGISHQTPEGINQALKDFGVDATYTRHGKFADLKKHLDNEQALIAQGHWTDPGHIITIAGYKIVNGKLFYIVNDPYGEWSPGGNYDYNNTYSEDTKGHGILYSDTCVHAAMAAYSLAQATDFYKNPHKLAWADGTLWFNAVSKN